MKARPRRRVVWVGGVPTQPQCKMRGNVTPNTSDAVVAREIRDGLVGSLPL